MHKIFIIFRFCYFLFTYSTKSLILDYSIESNQILSKVVSKPMLSDNFSISIINLIISLSKPSVWEIMAPFVFVA